MSDGTFKMAPKGFLQTYMLWYIAEGRVNDEYVNRSKAMLACQFVMKAKSETAYTVAFGILDRYRQNHGIAAPEFEEYMTDDEPAVRNVVGRFYSCTIFSLCYFHHNQNIVKCLTQHKLSIYIRKCKTDEQLWFYAKLKQILVIPLLPLKEIIPGFKALASSILSFIDSNFTNTFEKEQFHTFFDTIEERYFSHEEKIRLTCKNGKHMRCTNLVESSHSVFNKSSHIPKNGSIENYVQAMTTVDLQYRTLAIAFENDGASVFPKKKNRYVKQQTIVDECTRNLNQNKITVEDFLKRCSAAMIHDKYYKLIEAATERFENRTNVDNNEEIDEITAIFTTSESSNGRVRKLCSKYFGDDWLN